MLSNIFRWVGLTMLTVGVLITMISLVIFGNSLFDSDREVRYDCSIAEISPDYTPAMKEACRQLIRQQYEKSILRKSGTSVQASI